MSTSPSSTGRVSLNGTTFAYEITGSGHPLVLVHAGIADRRMWDEQVVAFAQHYQVIRYDMRGFGETPPVREPFYHHHDLHALLTSLGIESAYLLGCSMGGSTIVDFTLAYPQMTDALVLVTSALDGYKFTYDGEPPKQWDEVEAAMERGDTARAAELEVQLWVDGPQRTPEQVDPAIRDRVRAMDEIALKYALSVNTDEYEQELEPHSVHRLGEIHVPTLVIIGELDDPNILNSSELLASGIPGARRVVMHTAHLPNMEQPAEFNRCVLEFLSSL